MSIQAKKSLGQNFLVDQNLIRKIIHAMDIQPNEHLIEIGPGQGALTRHILAAGARVTVVEKDPRMVPILEELSAEFDNRLTVHLADALEIDFSTLGTPCKLVGNLPYNVGTPIVIKALEQSHNFPQMTFMLQREVIDRITAQPKSSDWGRLGVWCHLRANCKRLFDVPPSAFIPRPKVTSAIVQITPLEKNRFDVDTKKLSSLLLKCFTKRRKMLRASLKGTLTAEQIEAVGIPASARPEELSTEDFCKLTNLL